MRNHHRPAPAQRGLRRAATAGCALPGGPRALTAVITVIAAITIVVAGGAAGAQDELPTGPAQEPAPGTGSDPDSGRGGVDFGDAVIIDENGVRWNVATETSPSAVDPEPATPPSEASTTQGTTGTGRLERIPASGSITESAPADAPPPSGGSRGPVDPVPMASSLVVIGTAAAAAVLALSIVALAVRRRRTGREVEPAVIEEPVAVERVLDLSALAFDGGYDGADDAGAYQEGGAAYAQYAAAANGEIPVLVAEADSTLDRLASMRAAFVNRADKELAQSGHGRSIAAKLEAAGSKTRPGEWVVLTALVAVAAFGLVTVVTNPLLAAAAAAIAVYGSWYRLARLQGKRRKRFSDDLPETLQLLAGSLRGGQSMMQAIQTVADEADEPTASEFQRIITEARLGRDLAVSFRDLSGRMDSKDFDWVVTAIEIHRTVGGDLASILDRVGNTIRARNRVLGQVKALSAEGRMSGLLLFMLPPGMLIAISMLNPAYMQQMLDEPAGQMMLALAAALLGIGGLWLKKLSEFVY